MKVRIKDGVPFESFVFGADCFLANWPELRTTGIEVERALGYRGNVLYYVMENGRKVNDTAFFTAQEMRECLEVLPEHKGASQ